jgi:biopolymer transport protein ExbB/TolQ
MYEAFQSGGVMMWPLLLIAIGILGLAVHTGWVLIQSRTRAPVGALRLHTILFWGAMSVLLGLLGTIVGIVQMAQAVALAGGVGPSLLWGGFGLALVTLIFGLLIFAFSAVAWFALRQWHMSMVPGER